MTNKKFKVAAMSMALTACVAAQPLIANAADDVNAVSNEPTDSAPQSTEGSSVSAPVAVASVSSDPVTNQQDEGAVDVIGDPDISVDYNHDNDKVTKDDSSTTTESTGPVNRDVPIESEPGAHQPSGDGQQTKGDGQQTEGNGQQTEGNGQQTETDLNNEQKGEPKTDLNNEQEGSKDGDKETEKKPIGEAQKSETETKDTKLVLGESTTTTTTTTNPDGSTTTTTTTTTDTALETTTKVEGEASAKTEEDSSENVKKDTLKEELGGKDLSWDTEPNTKFGDYTVTDAVKMDDGTKTFTLTKEDKIETGEMTGLDISKLIEAGYTDNGDGTYTLTKEFTDSQGQKQTTTVKVDSSKATKTTSTTLTVTMASQEHKKNEDLGTKEDTKYPYPSTNVTVQDDKGTDHTFNVKDILDKAHDNGDGTFTYEDKENNLTYTITKNETDTKLDSLTDTELRDLLNDHAGSEKYTLDNEGNLCYITDKGEKCRVTDEQNALLRSVLKLGITITDHHGKESDTQKVENSEKTPEQAKADAEKTAQEDALKDALAQAINKETGKSLTKADITLPEVRDGKFEWTDPDTDKTYTFSYTEKGIVSSFEEIKDPTTVDKNASSAEKNTETGSAEVTGSTVFWTKEGKTLVRNDTKTDTTFGTDFNFRSVPSNFELDGDANYNEDGTLESFKTKDGKTYEFRYEKGSAPEDLKDISNPNFTKVTWTMTEKKVGSATSPDTSEPTHIEIERSFQKTEDNGTFTITETKEGGKTYSGLKKVDAEHNVYSNDDGTVTITVTTLTLGVEEIKAALEDKGYTDVEVNSDGTASYKDGNVTYNVHYNTTVESITVMEKETVKESSFTISVSDTNQKEAEDALKAKIAELRAGLKEGEYIEVNGHHVDQHTKVETIITYFKTAINYKNMSDDEIVAMLKKQKEDAVAEGEGKYYTGAGIGHDYWVGHYETDEKPNYIGHLDLATDSDLLLEDGKTTADAILLNKGDKKFKFEWNMSAEDLVNKNKPDKRAKFQDSISYDDGKQNGGDGSKGHYEYERQDTGSWIAPDSNNYPHESAYYRLTGTIAYNSLEDGKEYDTWNDANKALADWVKDHPNDKDYKPNIVALSKKDKWDREIIVYKAYTYESSLTAYGYMSKDSNTCVNSGYGDTGYGRAWAGGFDLRISGLTQVTKTESSAHGKNYYDYYADITKYKTVEQTSRPLANRLLDVIPGTKTVPTETTNTDTGSGLFGSYDQNHNETHNYEKPFTGAGTAEYTTYRTWEDTNAEWDGEFEKLTGAFGFNYTTTKDAEVTEASKKACVKTDSSVKYHYSYVERQELDPITETKTVTTPADDDGDDDDGGDKIIEEKDSDSPVLPGTPELPPVQDAKPDAPVLPADPALPAVQDAHALPQTGVNWLAAIGLALSGMTLMITGAFASLTGKNAKH